MIISVLQILITFALFGVSVFLQTDFFMTIGLLIGVCMSIMVINYEDADKYIKKISLLDNLISVSIAQIILFIKLSRIFLNKFLSLHRGESIMNWLNSTDSNFYLVLLFILNAILIAINLKAYKADKEKRQ